MAGLLGTPVKFKEKANNASTVAVSYFKAHWLDYLLLVGIFFILGAFDVFVLKRSDRFLTAEYWYHSACRISAFILAAILGVRIGYPKAKALCEDLADALRKNKKLVLLKQLDGQRFSKFICETNIEVKKNAWKAHVRKKLKKLERFVPNFFPIYYQDEKRDDEVFTQFSPRRAKWLKSRAQKYCFKREKLEALITDEYIDKNIRTLNIRYPRIKETDFNQIIGHDIGYKTYKTIANVKGNSARAIGSSILFTIVLTLLLGSVKLSFDEEMFADRLVTIFSVIINTLLDIGLTIWRFLNGYLDCPRIVREEDLRACIDRNELLVLYKKDLPQELIDEYEKELLEQETQSAEIEKELKTT